MMSGGGGQIWPEQYCQAFAKYCMILYVLYILGYHIYCMWYPEKIIGV